MSLADLTQSSLSVPRELLAELGSAGIQSLLELMRDAYFDLIDAKKDFTGMSENDITEEWVMFVMKRWRASKIPSSIIPIHEKQDKSKASKRGRPPTIDFCFRGEWDKLSYFGAECKLIEADDKNLCDEYVDQGVKRYIEGKYNPKCPDGAMIGYVRRTRCISVANEIYIRIIASENDAKLEKVDNLLPFGDYYVSNHTKVKISALFKIHHLLFSLPSSN